MARSRIHPKAYLPSIRNVKAGIASRTKIFFALEEGRKTARTVSKEVGLTYGCIMYHMRLLHREKLVEASTAKRPYTWALTKFGQQELI